MVEIAVQINGKTKATLAIGKEDPKDEVIAKAKEVIADKLTGNVIKEIYVPGRIVNIVMKQEYMLIRETGQMIEEKVMWNVWNGVMQSLFLFIFFITQVRIIYIDIQIYNNA